MFKKAFTLAEVLITLTVIGIIAAITIPTTIINHQKQQAVVQLKKAYSTLANTTNKAIMDNGQTKIWDMGDGWNFETHKAFAKKYITPYLRISKMCETKNDPSCVYEIRKAKNSNETLDLSNVFIFYLADGTTIVVTAQTAEPLEKRAEIHVDINGKKAPNLLGKDVFIFGYYLKDSRIMPFQHSGSVSSLATNTSYYHWSSLIMKNNWKIPTKEEFVNWGGNPELYPW
ncbi:MAG: type II secretion system protein [Cyanobacteria bacterium SIG30]|nr:type II secretion system protein [Cyanobacteria bacterium SIG30]